MTYEIGVKVEDDLLKVAVWNDHTGERREYAHDAHESNTREIAASYRAIVWTCNCLDIDWASVKTALYRFYNYSGRIYP